MSRKTRSLAACYGLAFVFVTFCAIAQQAPPIRGTGDDWMSWPPETRRMVVIAYISGIVDGKMRACVKADQLFELDKVVQDPKDTVASRCLDHLKSFTLGVEDDYRAILDEFYAKHPEYRRIPAVYLVSRLTDDEYKTAEALYQAAVRGEIRTNF